MTSCSYVVYSPSRFSYMGWTPDFRVPGLRPCYTKQVFGSKEEAEELACRVGDGVVQKADPQPVVVDVDVTYW